jgi:hypothetical protein
VTVGGFLDKIWRNLCRSWRQKATEELKGHWFPFKPFYLHAFEGVAMVFKSVVGVPLVMETVEQELMLHAQGIAESKICEGREHSVVLMYGEKPKCMYQIADHGGAFSMNRIYTFDDEQLLVGSLMSAESAWPTRLEVHNCPNCLRMAPGLATLILRADGSIASLICHLAAACGDAQEALNAMRSKAFFLRSFGIDTFPVWVDSDKYRVPKCIWCPPLTLKKQ